MTPISKLQQQVIEKFDKNYPELSVIEGQGDEGSIHGYDAKPYIKEFILNTIEEAYKSGREELFKIMEEGYQPFNQEERQLFRDYLKQVKIQSLKEDK